MDVSKLFNWVRSKQDNKKLEQPQVDAVNTMLVTMPANTVQDTLAKLNDWSISADKPSKKLSKSDVVASAKALGVEAAALKSVIDVEARSSGFDNQGRPTILFERHKMWKYLGEINYFTWRKKLNAEHPDVCHKDAGAYNVRSQYEKLAIAEAVNWDAAHKSASWGLGQVMGFNFASLGYTDLKEFIDAMYESEAKQLDAMCRYIKVNNLVDDLQRHDWKGFAKGYNGSAYAKNKYDDKLRAAYAKAKKEGW